MVMIDDLREMFIVNFDKFDWMDNKIRVYVREKVYL